MPDRVIEFTRDIALSLEVHAIRPDPGHFHQILSETESLITAW
jgi:hypothetical protein